ncbi:MAG: class I SAM-dependent methyltransferase [Vicinamibacterales bacterium]
MNEREPPNLDATRLAEVVRAFYEDHPYPPPVDDLEKYRAWQDPQKRRAEYHLLWPSRPFEEDYSILVAGCGTSQAAKHAMRWPGARVTGIDFSETSVRCTDELKRRYRLDNLEVHRLPIERARELQTHFDQIVCTGVLHHLPDPDAGLSALREVLAPGGAMNLMLYAPYGRTGIYLLQDFCRKLGIVATDVEIRDLIVALKALPPGHPLQYLLREAPDFRNEAALADALLHPCDRAYSVPQLLAFIRQGGLRFGRWVRQATYSPKCGEIARLPQASRMQRLPMEEQYAAVELFRGTMLRHSVIAHRDDDAPDSIERISFAGDAWLAHVPVRMPDTVCVRERLPPGAAAVLISQSHTYNDIYLPIDETELHILDSIDGDRSIGEIIAQTLPPSQQEPRNALVRAYFERLWWHDQIVFDTSRS